MTTPGLTPTRNLVRTALLATALAAPLAATPALAAQVGGDITVKVYNPVSDFASPQFTFLNLSDSGYLLTQVEIIGGFIDYVLQRVTPTVVPIIDPTGGSHTALGTTQVASTDQNDGCNQVKFGMTGFDPGENFSFVADPEPNNCSSAVVQFNTRLDADAVTGSLTFSGPGIAGTTTLSGSNWVKELIDPQGQDIAENWLYRLSLSTVVDTPPIDAPEPGTLALLGVGMLGLSALRRRRPAAA